MRLIAVRRAVQILAVAGLCVLPWVNAAGWRGVSGSFFALDFLGIPFADPVGAAQVAAMGFLPAGRLLGGALLSLGLALLLGRVFCSWVCPYGLLSELVYTLRWRRSGARLVVRQAFWGKILLLVLGLVAALGPVRVKMVDLQRKMAERGGVLMDGRDIATNVLPNADVKIFLTASPHIRAVRRYEELKEKGISVEPIRLDAFTGKKMTFFHDLDGLPLELHE